MGKTPNGKGKLKQGILSNIYYQFLNGHRYRSNSNDQQKINKEYFVGDENGNPVGGASFGIFCGKFWYNPHPSKENTGPCFFRPYRPGINAICISNTIIHLFAMNSD